MIIKIDTDRKTITLPKHYAERIKQDTTCLNVTTIEAIENNLYLKFNDLNVVAEISAKRNITEEEHQINKLKVEDIKAIMKTKPQEEQDDFNLFMKAREKEIEGQLTKNGEQKQVNAMKIKSWYKKKYLPKKEQ